MRILSLHIENFGKLSNFDYVFEEGLNTINKDNAWGKTTLATFIKAMFYGMEKKGNNKAYAAERSKFLPWQGGTYGGSLVFETKGKTYRVLRIFGVTPESDRFELIDLATNKNSRDFSASLGEELFGVGRETFTLSTFFPQGMLEGEINDEMRASLSGTSQFGGDAEKHSAAIKKLKSLSRELTLANPKAYDILSCENEILDGKNELSALEDRKQELKEERDNLKEKLISMAIPKGESDFSLNDINRNLIALNESSQDLQRQSDSLSAKQKSAKIKLNLIYSVAFIFAIVAVVCGFAIQMDSVPLILGLCFGIVALILAIIAFFLTKPIKKFKEEEKKLLEQKYALLEKKKSVEEEYSKVSQNAAFILNINQERSDIDKTLAVCENNLIHIEKEIAALMERIDQAETRLANLKSKKEETEEKLTIVSSVIEFLNQAQENISQRYVQPMQQKFSEIISQLSSDKTIKLDVDLKLGVDTQTGLKEKQFLSKGKQDLVEICKRFALIQSIFTKEAPFIILDDPFVNLDEQSLKNMLQLIQKFAKSMQIIYLVCHTSRETKSR